MLREVLQTEQTFHARDLENIWLWLEGRAERDASGNCTEREREGLYVSVCVCAQCNNRGRRLTQEGVTVFSRWMSANASVCVCMLTKRWLKRGEGSCWTWKKTEFGTCFCDCVHLWVPIMKVKNTSKNDGDSAKPSLSPCGHQLTGLHRTNNIPVAER